MDRSIWGTKVGGRRWSSSELCPSYYGPNARAYVRAFAEGFAEMAHSLPLEELEVTGLCVVSLAGLEVPLNRDTAFELCELWAEGAVDLRKRTWVMTPTRPQRIGSWARAIRARALQASSSSPKSSTPN